MDGLIFNLYPSILRAKKRRGYGDGGMGRKGGGLNGAIACMYRIGCIWQMVLGCGDFGSGLRSLMDQQ